MLKLSFTPRTAILIRGIVIKIIKYEMTIMLIGVNICKKKQFSSVPLTLKFLSTSLNNFEKPSFENIYGKGHDFKFPKYLNCSGNV